MRRVDASRADFRGASLVGVAVHGAMLRRANCQHARMAGMWSGPGAETRPKVKADKDGMMPPMEPLKATDEDAVEWVVASSLGVASSSAHSTASPFHRILLAEEGPGATSVNTAKDGDEDAQDETAWAAHKQELREKYRMFRTEKQAATVVDMQHMAAW